MSECDNVCADPVHNCYAAPWCACCDSCGPPGGGGAFLPKPSSYSPTVWPGDHGKFASWRTSGIYAASVVKLSADGKLADLLITMANGSQFIEPSIEVASPARFDAYLNERKLYQQYLREELKSAYTAWMNEGRDPLRSVYCSGYYYPSNHDFRNAATIVEELTDPRGQFANITAKFRRHRGEMFLSSVHILNPESRLGPWLTARGLWLPRYADAVTAANARIASYLGTDYSV